MFWKKKSKAPAPPTSDALEPAIESMRYAVQNAAPKDPLIAAKMTSKDITGNLLEMLKDDRGVRVETALGVLGTLSGFSASYAMIEAVNSGKIQMAMPEVAIAELKSGERAMMGNYINRKVAEGEAIGGQTLSLWHLIAGMVQHLGQTTTVNLEEIFGRTAQTIGTEAFWKLNLPDAHHPGDSIQNFVTHLFPKFLPILQRYDLPVDQYYLAFSLSAQEVLQMAKDTIAPDLAAQIIMECAIPASKIDPAPFFEPQAGAA